MSRQIRSTDVQGITGSVSNIRPPASGGESPQPSEVVVISLEPADFDGVRVLRRKTDRSRIAYVTVNQSTSVDISWR